MENSLKQFHKIDPGFHNLNIRFYNKSISKIYKEHIKRWKQLESSSLPISLTEHANGILLWNMFNKIFINMKELYLQNCQTKNQQH